MSFYSNNIRIKSIRIECVLIFLVLLMYSCKSDNVEPIQETKLLHATRGENPGIYDQKDRFVLLRGCAYNSLGDYWQGNNTMPPVKKYEAVDFERMAKYGMNVVRFVITWSKVEPERGKYNYAYIDSLKMAIEDANKHGIYILIDMHQDAWGKYIITPPNENCTYPCKGWDGAPQWATITDGASTCMTEDGFRESPPAVIHAFHNLWSNTDGIADAFFSMWQEIVKATAKYENVLGYDILNEPSLGYEDLITENNRYSLFLGKAVQSIRAAEKISGGLEHIIVFEHTVTWNGQKIPFTPNTSFTNDKNIVFSGHNYFTERDATILSLEDGYNLFLGLAKLYQTAFFCGEWAYSIGDLDYIYKVAQIEDKNKYGSTYWLWAAPPGDPHFVDYNGTTSRETTMLLIETNQQAEFTGNYNTSALNIIARPYPRNTNGKIRKLKSDPDTGILTMEASANSKGITEIWVNDRFGMPKISGENINTKAIQAISGGYLVLVECQKDYKIQINY